MTGRKAIGWVAFDAVGTLIYPDAPVARVYARVAAECGSQLSETEIAERFHAAFAAAEQQDFDGSCEADWKRADRLRTSEPRERERWRRIVATAIPDVRDPESCFERLFEHFGRPDAWRCYSDVAPALVALRAAGHRLAIASNFDARLHAVRAGLAELGPIQLCVVSSEVGYRKPSGFFYRALVEQAGCRADEILMVGDDEPNDGRGARAAGLRAVVLNRAAVGASTGEVWNLLQLSETLTHKTQPLSGCDPGESCDHRFAS